ncbi:DinB superfamily protein [Marivirga sericea]|uniref:DinB superfamily protein n=1 Tax=Marivirga sericea TaxID=1028 RepID=A0A1X7IP40_9BACT|nr:DinB family protein [Marivirga sericea]SMG16494.1 DinB superfamily protein [Marivirga sericea]
MQVITNHKAIRKNFEKAVEKVNEADLVLIPAGFNNHIIWNIGHVIATQNVLIYGMSGLDFTLPTDFIKRYKKGSFPAEIDQPKTELETIFELGKIADEQLGYDIKEMRFGDYQQYETSFGITLNSFNDALQFNNIHESLHLGYVMAMKRALGY